MLADTLSQAGIIGTYFLCPHWKGLFLGVLVDLLESSLEPFLAECSASSPPLVLPRSPLPATAEGKSVFAR